MVIVQAGAAEDGEGKGVEEPAETAVMTVLAEELAQLCMNDGAGQAKELLA